MYSETFPRWGTVRHGALMEQTPWVRPIAVTESSSSPDWATPAASWWEGRGATSAETWEKRQSARVEAGKAPFATPLHVQVQLWPTPAAAAATQGRNEPDGKRGQTFVGAARDQLWPTPTSGDSTRGGDVFKRGNLTLPGMARRQQAWPTPNARDHKGSPGQESRERGGHQASLPSTVQAQTWPTPRASMTDMDTMERSRYSGQQMKAWKEAGTPYQTQTTGSLNTAWVEMLQGFPPGWTEIE